MEIAAFGMSAHRGSALGGNGAKILLIGNRRKEIEIVKPTSQTANTAMIEAAVSALLAAMLAEGTVAATGEFPLDTDADPEYWELEVIISSPVATACQSEIRRLGQMLFDRLGKTTEMLPVLNKVAARQGVHENRCVNILDRAWHGVGRDGDRWIS